MEFKDRLESLRREKGISQADIAEACGVSITTFRRWEWGTQEPRLSELKKLAAALGMTTAELLDEGSADRVTLRHGALSLDIPTTPEGMAFLERKLAEIRAAEKSPELSSSAG